jgi:hypothetical protein
MARAFYGPATETTGETGTCQKVTRTRGPFGGEITKVTGVLCDDGKRRTARTTGTADSYFSQPACVTVAGKTVTGFIISGPDADGKTLWYFHANRFGKNYRFLRSKTDQHKLTTGLCMALDELWYVRSADGTGCTERGPVKKLRDRLNDRLYDRGAHTDIFKRHEDAELLAMRDRWVPVVKKHFNIP